MKTVTTFSIPNFQTAVTRCRYNQITIGRKDTPVYGLIVPFENMQEQTSLETPQSRNIVTVVTPTQYYPTTRQAPINGTGVTREGVL